MCVEHQKTGQNTQQARLHNQPYIRYLFVIGLKSIFGLRPNRQQKMFPEFVFSINSAVFFPFSFQSEKKQQNWAMFSFSWRHLTVTKLFTLHGCRIDMLNIKNNAFSVPLPPEFLPGSGPWTW